MPSDPTASVDVSADPVVGDRHAVSFAVVRRGYEQAQVDHVLVETGQQIEALQVELAELREREADLLAALDAAEYRATAAEAAVDDLRTAAAARPVTDEPAGPVATDVGPAEAPSIPMVPEPAALVDEPEPPRTSTGSEGDVAVMVGEETTRIVDAARHAAIEIGVRARDEAEQVVAAAREEARLIRADAEVELLHRTREADDALAARLLESADALQEAKVRAEVIVADGFTEAATVVLRARDEAEAVVAAAEQRSAELVAAAEAARDDLLVDLVRRRKVLRTQVEQLEAGRVRLRAAYSVVEGALVEATGELDRTVAEARDAAIAAAGRAATEDDPEVRAAAEALGADPDALVARADPDAATLSVRSASTTAAEAPAPVAPSAPTDEPEPTRAAVETDRPADAGLAATPVGEAAGDAERAIDLRRSDEPSPVRVATVTAAEPLDAADAVDSGDADPAPSEPSEEPAARRRRRRAPDPVEFEGRWSSAVRVLPPGPRSDDAPDPPDAPAPRTPGSAAEVFARLRARDAHQPSLFDDASGGSAAGGPAASVVVPSPTETETEIAIEATDPGRGSDPEAAWITRRDAAVAPALRALRRRLKATLADDEDSLLEAIRRAPSVPAAVDSLRDAEARRADLGVALVASISTAATAGAELARTETGATGADAPATVDLDLDGIAGALADVVVDPLDERLERCIARYHRTLADASRGQGSVGVDDVDAAAAAVDDATRDAAMASLVSSVKAAYRARRGAQVQVPTEHAVLLAGHRGLVGALEPGTPLRWVVAPPAPAPRRGSGGHPASGELEAGDPPGRACASCVAVADVGAGDPFGHGPLLPPARPGCRCAVAPVSAVVPRRP